MALDTDEKQSLLEGDVYGAAGIEKSQAHSREMLMTLRGSKVGESVGRGHI